MAGRQRDLPQREALDRALQSSGHLGKLAGAHCQFGDSRALLLRRCAHLLGARRGLHADDSHAFDTAAYLSGLGAYASRSVHGLSRYRADSMRFPPSRPGKGRDRREVVKQSGNIGGFGGPSDRL